MGDDEQRILREVNDNVRREMKGEHRRLVDLMRKGELDADGLQLELGRIEASKRSWWDRQIRGRK